MMGLNPDWRVLDGELTAWFEAPSLTAGSALSAQVVSLSGTADLRRSGVRVRLGTIEHADAMSASARELGLTADPTVLQQLKVVLESPNPVGIEEFWQRVTEYAAADHDLVDPLRRDPALLLRPTSESRPLRNRVHLDVVRPAQAVEQADAGEASGPYGVRHRDADGNEVDLVPGDVLGETETTAEWHAVFSAMACYRVDTPAKQADLVAAAAELADKTGFPLVIDLRPGLVILDSGKDLWEESAGFAELAARLQTVARGFGATADATIPRFVQLFLDAADVEAVRRFWLAVLGYRPDPRAQVTDINDPRRLNPVFVFQELDASDTARRQQRNRIHIELTVPSDVAERRVATAGAAGGRVIDQAENHWQIADPEGNELVIVGAN